MKDDARADKPLVLEDFSDKVGQSFVISEQGLPAIAFKLRKAEPLNPAFGLPGVRPPFSLFLVAEDPRILPQRIYRLANDALGEVSIVLVPVAKDAQGVTYQAVFN